MNRQTGFSLIELTVVLLLITLLTSVAIRETSELGFQTRYEQTKERLEMIRQAILGNPKLIINGQQAVSGFVADMGRLPDAVRELLQMGFCVTATASDPPAAGEVVTTNTTYRQPQDCGGTNVWRWTSAPCTDGVSSDVTACSTAGHVWLAKQPDTTLNSGLSYGWNGPYLTISDDPNSATALTDGWGRQGVDDPVTTGLDEATADYGWRFFDLSWLTANIGDADNLVVQSYGKNQQADNAIPLGEDYDHDYPENRYLFSGSYYPNPLIEQHDWRLDISSGISANFIGRFDGHGHCGFLSTGSYAGQTQCQNAGGNWSGSACTLNEDSCKSVGGKWQSCFFSPAACATAGGTSRATCYFGESACNAAGGASGYDTTTTPTCGAAGGYWDGTVCRSWDGDNTHPTTYRRCLVNSQQTLCANAGGTWNSSTSNCNFNQASCALAGGDWMQDCTFTQSTCENLNGVGAWHSTSRPDSCVFTEAQCVAVNGNSNGSDCYMSHAEASGAKYEANSCLAASGSWSGNICMNIFYRDPLTSTVVNLPSQPVSIEENGAYQTVQFTFTTPPLIPAGVNAIGIYEYDGDCNLDNPLYPAGRQNPIQVDFHAHATLPVINW